MAVRCEKAEGHVAILTLDLPELRNALTAEMRVELRDALSALESDSAVRAVVLTGAGGHFCAGGDVRTMGETDPARIDQRMNDVALTAEAVAAFPKPLVAAVCGHAAGGGIGLACLADVIVAEETAQFTFSFLRLALGPDWGLSHTLAHRVGAAAAKRLILGRGRLDAAEAHRLGLADMLAKPGEALSAAMEAARDLAAGPMTASGAVKRMMSDLDGLRAALKAEAAMQRERFPAWEHQEGAAAFREKRPPDFLKDGD
jgi:2-(1,2-epoxy-1,2-dihydrophenyl)acetyl-CoA isomerase